MRLKSTVLTILRSGSSSPACELLLHHAGQLNTMGVIKYFADVVGGKLVAMNLGWQPVFGLLNVAYFGLHYMFASQTAHVGALYSAFLAMMLSAGTVLFMLQLQWSVTALMLYADAVKWYDGSNTPFSSSVLCSSCCSCSGEQHCCALSQRLCFMQMLWTCMTEQTCCSLMCGHKLSVMYRHCWLHRHHVSSALLATLVAGPVLPWHKHLVISEAFIGYRRPSTTP